jgi:hypothetical protein
MICTIIIPLQHKNSIELITDLHEIKLDKESKYIPWTL